MSLQNAILLLTSILFSQFYISYSVPFSLHEFNDGFFEFENFYVSYENDVNKKNYLLPDTIQPKEYYLKIIPYFQEKDFMFDGEITILLHIKNSTNKIVLNSVYLNFNETAIKIEKINAQGTAKENITVRNVEIGNLTEQVTITTGALLAANSEYNLIIKYNGYLSDNMNGFYRSWYTDKGNVRWLGTTQMESPHARTVFPCFDEPRFRASFTIQIARRTDIKTISNMPLLQTTAPDSSIGGLVWDIYEKSPPMATYLVAFCVFDFKKVNSEHVTVWAQPSVMDQTGYILDKVKNILEILNNFTSINYKISKMELVAVPDFSAGAMENWGLTTYREKYLLYKENISTPLDKQRVLSVVAHEMTHQWFGNLVTPVWWDYLWLNEAFATFFEFYIPSIMEPSWRMMDQFVVTELQYALSEDVGIGHPLNANVTTSLDTEAIFDVYEYSKGGSIIRMMQHFCNPENFITGIRQYLKDGVNEGQGTVNPTSLWNAFNKTLPKNLLPERVTFEEIMKTWTEQRGFPLITVTRNYTDKTMAISQKEFLNENSKENSSRQWWVPLTFTDSKKMNFESTKTNLWLGPQKEEKVKLTTDGWILFNIQQTGYYRVNYDIKNWNLLIDQLIKDHTAIPPINRAQIIDDSFALARACIIPYEIPLTISRYLITEKDYIPWLSTISVFQNLIQDLYFTSSGSLLKAFVQNLVRPIYLSVTKIPLENRSHVNKLLISSILSFACKINLKDCEIDLVEKFNNWNLSPSSNLVPEMKEAVVCTGLRVISTEQSWNNVWTYYNNSNVASEKFSVLRSLGCITKPEVLKKYLTMLTITKEPPLEIRKHDYSIVFSAVAARPDNTGTALNFLMDNFQLLQNVMNTKTLKSMFGSLAYYSVKAEDFKKFQQFYDKNKDSLGELSVAINETLSDLKIKMDWSNKFNDGIERFLNSQLSTVTISPSTEKLTTQWVQTTAAVPKSSKGYKQYCSQLLVVLFVLLSLNVT